MKSKPIPPTSTIYSEFSLSKKDIRGICMVVVAASLFIVFLIWIR
jgi:hypothetical protein